MDLDVTRPFFDVSYRVVPTMSVLTVDDTSGQALIDQSVAILHVDPPDDPNRVPETGSGIIPMNVTRRVSHGSNKGKDS
jgi:hypothetical protein